MIRQYPDNADLSPPGRSPARQSAGVGAGIDRVQAAGVKIAEGFFVGPRENAPLAKPSGAIPGASPISYPARRQPMNDRHPPPALGI
jgi:hypothetical protein